MGDFRSDKRSRSRSRSGGRKDSRGGRERGFRDSGHRRTERKPPEMHDAICSKCGKQCQIPFKPRTDKPLFCDDCFKQNEAKRRQSDQGMSLEQFNQINEKLDKILKALKIEQ